MENRKDAANHWSCSTSMELVRVRWSHFPKVVRQRLPFIPTKNQSTHIVRRFSTTSTLSLLPNHKQKNKRTGVSELCSMVRPAKNNTRFTRPFKDKGINLWPTHGIAVSTIVA